MMAPLSNDLRKRVVRAIEGGLSRRAARPRADRAFAGLGSPAIREAPLTGLRLFPTERLLVALDPPSRSPDDILGKLFVHVGSASVAWEDFEHLGAGRDFAFRLLRGALERREKGVNILLHGVPGTGKTEFCKALSDRLGTSLRAVGEADDDGDEPSRFERLQQLRLGQRLLSDQDNSIILFDEMEDLFPGLDNGVFGLSLRRAGSKVHINRLLESNPVPTLWTTNDISDCDPAFLRRISFTLELRTPPVSVRSRIWEKLAVQHPGAAAPRALPRTRAQHGGCARACKQRAPRGADYGRWGR